MTRTARIEIVPADITEGTTTRTARATEAHYLRLIAANGEPLATSELLSTRSNARRAATSWLRAMRQVADAGNVTEVTS